jgi:hypothetical protein
VIGPVGMRLTRRQMNTVHGKKGKRARSSKRTGGGRCQRQNL